MSAVENPPATGNVRISSRKLDAGNGRRRHDFDGEIAGMFGIVFSGSSLILNLTDGNRSWHVVLDDAATAGLARRFAERAKGGAE